MFVTQTVRISFCNRRQFISTISFDRPILLWFCDLSFIQDVAFNETEKAAIVYFCWRVFEVRQADASKKGKNERQGTAYLVCRTLNC